MLVRSSFLGNAVAAKSRFRSHAKKRYVRSPAAWKDSSPLLQRFGEELSASARPRGRERVRFLRHSPSTRYGRCFRHGLSRPRCEIKPMRRESTESRLPTVKAGRLSLRVQGKMHCRRVLSDLIALDLVGDPHRPVARAQSEESFRRRSVASVSTIVSKLDAAKDSWPQHGQLTGNRITALSIG
jgi:hypothetical protein